MKIYRFSDSLRTNITSPICYVFMVAPSPHLLPQPLSPARAVSCQLLMSILSVAFFCDATQTLNFFRQPTTPLLPLPLAHLAHHLVGPGER